MRVSEAVVDRLLANGVTAVFGIPGTQTLPLNAAIEARDELRHVLARHETAVSHQAWGYAEAGGGLAATLVVPGPGDMNAMNGLKNARNDATPLVHLSVETEPELRGGDAIHETPPETYDTVVKANRTVATPTGAPVAIDQAARTALTPPQGPVRIGIPRNFLTTEIGPVGSPSDDALPTPAPAGPAVDRAVALLEEATAPVVIAGGGVRRAEAEEQLRATAEHLDAPVLTTLKGKGTFSEDHPLSAGLLLDLEPAVRSLLDRADAALAVGSDLDAVTTGNWALPLPDQLVHVTLDSDDLGRGYDPAVGLAADAAATLDVLSDRLGPGATASVDGPSRAAAVRDARAERLAALRERDDRLRSPDVSAAARDAIPRDAIVTADGGGLRIWMNVAFEAYAEGRYIQPGSWATMGSALPSAIGAALAADDRPVVAMVGDGGLLMALHELHTVVAESLPITTLVTNNDGYAIISESAQQAHDLGPDTYDWGGAPIDFTAVAGGLGMPATRVDTTAELREALGAAIAADEPRLVEVGTVPHEPQALHWMAGT